MSSASVGESEAQLSRIPANAVHRRARAAPAWERGARRAEQVRKDRWNRRQHWCAGQHLAQPTGKAARTYDGIAVINLDAGPSQGCGYSGIPKEHLDAGPSDEGCGAYDGIAGINLDAGPPPGGRCV